MSNSKNTHSHTMSSVDVSVGELARHLGVSRNRAPRIAAHFGLKKESRGFRKVDVFRRIHGLEPLLLARALDALKARQSWIDPNEELEEGAEPKRVCILEELAEIDDLVEALWRDGLVHVTGFAAEYGYAYDSFRKKLKAGEIALPPVAPIELSANKTMYRPLEVVLWRRHGLALDLPRVAKTSQERAEQNATIPPQAIPSDATSPEAMTEAVFALAMSAADAKSDLQEPPAPFPDDLHDARQ